MELTAQAKMARIERYSTSLRQKLSKRLIDTGKADFNHLRNDKGQPMTSLDGSILLGLDYFPNGSLRGVKSIDVSDLASILPDVKVDVEDKTGMLKYLQQFSNEDIDILSDVDEPKEDEYSLTVEEELKKLDVASLSALEALAKLTELKQKVEKQQ